jgi:hypothetical protein
VVEAEGVEVERFLASIEAVRVGRMAAKPITLKMLIAEFATGHAVTAARGSQTYLYRRGILSLCEEPRRPTRHGVAVRSPGTLAVGPAASPR